MKILLDTHAFLWSLLETKKLSPLVSHVLSDGDTEVFLSTVSFWEISLKYALGKLKLKGLEPSDLPKFAEKLDYKILPLDANESASFHQLKKLYGDPFDRMLVWQAIQQKLTLVSVDKKLKAYQKLGLALLW